MALASETNGTALAVTTTPPACIVGTTSLTIAQRDSITGGIAADTFSVESGSVVTGGANIDNVGGSTVRIAGATIYGTFDIAGAAPSAANGELINGGRILDTVVTNAGVQAVLPTQTVTPGTTSITVNSGDRPRTITPGAYAAVTVNGSTITFSAGTYRLSSLTINSGANVVLDVSRGAIAIDVAGTITVNGGVFSTADPAQVTYYSNSTATNAVTLNAGITSFPGTITAPRGGVSIGSRITLAGCVGGRTVNIEPDTTAGVAPIVGDCGVGPRGSGSGTVDYVLVYSSPLTKWCVDRDFWSQPPNAAAITKFFGYGDAFYVALQTLFKIPRTDQLIIEANVVPGGGAHTGTDFGFGVTVDGAAFRDPATDPVTGLSIPGFYGYLLPLHEAINVFTGLVSPGWPRDWWADDRSPFPNWLDESMLQALGTARQDPIVLEAAVAQHDRFSVPGQPGFDQEVVMFDDLANQFGGFSAYGNMFALVEADGIQWDDVASHTNPSPLLTEYVIAYLQLGFRTSTDLTQSVFVAAGVGTLDTSIPPYSVDSGAVRAISTAHCSIRAAAAAGVDVSAQLSALRSGSFQNAVAPGGTQATCPTECAWNTSTASCTGRW